MIKFSMGSIITKNIVLFAKLCEDYNFIREPHILKFFFSYACISLSCIAHQFSLSVGAPKKSCIQYDDSISGCGSELASDIYVTAEKKACSTIDRNTHALSSSQETEQKFS